MTTNRFGDANFDLKFDEQDFVDVFIAGEYLDEVPFNSTWATGDWDGDGDFTSADILFVFQFGHYDSGARASIPNMSEAPNRVGQSLFGEAGQLKTFSA